MSRITYDSFSPFGFTLAMPLIAVIWAATMPGGMQGLALVVLTVITVATGAFILNTWRNAQPAEIPSHVVPQGEVPGAEPVFVRPMTDRRVAAGRLLP